MARQNVGSPKFYIDLFQYWRVNGELLNVGFESEWDQEGDNVTGLESCYIGGENYRGDLLSLNPSSVKTYDWTYGWDQDVMSLDILFRRNMTLPTSAPRQEMWAAFLGHNFSDKSMAPYRIQFLDGYDATIDGIDPEPDNWTQAGSIIKFAFDNNYNVLDMDIAIRGNNRVNCSNEYSTPLGDTMFPYPYNGWSLAYWEGNPSQDVEFNAMKIYFTTEDSANLEHFANEGGYPRNGVQLNTIGFGVAYTMPQSPDLSLQLIREYDGIKNKDTIGGSTLTQIDYSGPRNWGAIGAWEITDKVVSGYREWYADGEGTQTIAEPEVLERILPTTFRGRRVWDLSFKYLSDTDIFSINELVSKLNPTNSSDPDVLESSGYDEGDFDREGDFKQNIYEDVSFFAQLIEKTANGNLRFIFQPDSNNNSPDQFAICQFDMKDISFKQVAFRVYDIKMKIREVW